MVSVCVLFVIIGTAVLVAAGAGESWFHRRISRPERARSVALAVSVVVVTANVACFILDPVESWKTATHGASFAALTALGILLYGWRVDAPPALLPRRVLAIGAHPDDLELACGATLAKFVDAGHEVHGLVMSDGKVGGDAALRADHAMKGASFIGLTSLRHSGFTDTKLDADSQGMINVIEEAVRRLNPDIILTHSNHDQHQDHQAVHFATLRAARQHPSILCFESPSATREFNPSVFVDVEGYVDAKVRAVSTHMDQMSKPYMTPDRVRGVAFFRGGQAKRKVAEGYEPVRLLTADLEGL